MQDNQEHNKSSNSMKSLISMAKEVFPDLMTVLGIPAGALTALMENYFHRRSQEGLSILLNELKQGEIDSIEAAGQDEKIAVIYRYALAIRDGAARRNLKLLARVIVGLAQRDRLFADEFNKYAEILSKLSRDEILVLGTLHRYKSHEEKTRGRNISTHQWWPKAIEELVPGPFATEEHVVAVCCSALRSGLLLMPRDWDSTGEFATSPIMDEIAELADFQNALRGEMDVS